LIWLISIQAGLFGVVCRQGETTWRMQKSAIMIGIALDFVRVSWEGGWEVVDMVLSLTHQK